MSRIKPSKCVVFCPGCGKNKMLFETQLKADRFIEFNGESIGEKKEKLQQEVIFAISVEVIM